MKYENLKRDARMIWKMLAIKLSDGLSLLDANLIAAMLLEGIQGLATYLDETDAAEKRRYALALVDEIYAKEIRPRRMMPEGESAIAKKMWDATEEAIDAALGLVLHRAAEEILDKLLTD